MAKQKRWLFSLHIGGFMLQNLTITSISFNKRSRDLILTGMFALLSTSVFAEDKMKPGLWEMAVKSDLLNSLKSIPPAQMEELKKRGVKIPEIKDGAMLQKVCITKEMAERTGKPGMQNNPSGCKEKNSKRVGNSFVMELVCDTAKMKGTGTVQVNFTEKSLQTTYDFKGLAYNRPMNQHIETNGKWLSSDCGDVKPVGAPGSIPSAVIPGNK
ncbi:DUF3617 domain-containing protein [Undibacterium fentianense]|uniref:DUF3617 domain-containing protein n=1 Tax=Undibacterium fentianense TaxID=2828728 RepID=A0A941E1P1_9BURK|nr:DUF3617 domain-containing protein [Undibacterium fentianense]MBR7799019.1 DUF3617 domain-containing protein [Undibacterium fentianense]